MRNKVVITILGIIIMLLFSFFLKNYLQNEKAKYDYYADFTRAEQVMTLSFSKNYQVQYLNIRMIQSKNIMDKLGKWDLIYDFANYNMLPSLSLLRKDYENENLYIAFENFTDFLANYNMAVYGNSEKILLNNNGSYYVENNGIYSYVVKKKVITIESFNSAYTDYLKTIGEKSVESNIAGRLAKNNNSDSYNSIYKNILNKDDVFYQLYSEQIMEAVATDIRNFTNYLYHNYVKIDEHKASPPRLIQDFVTEEIEIRYNFKKFDRIYNSASKYYKYSYLLDIESLWEQITSLGYPKLYI